MAMTIDQVIQEYEMTANIGGIVHIYSTYYTISGKTSSKQEYIF